MHCSRLTWLLVLGILWAVPLDAGTVFLKNKYIIQGKVQELDDEKLVLGWRNGQMTIYRRFIEDFILDLSEEDYFRNRPSPEEEVAESYDSSDLEMDVHLQLPSTIEEIIAIHNDRMTPTGPTIPGVEGPTGGPGTTPPGVVVIPPAPTLPDEVEFSAAGFALIPPLNWEILHEEEGVRILKPNSGEYPSLTVQVTRAEGLPTQHALDELRALLIEGYTEVNLTEEHEEQVGFERAYILEGEFPSMNLSFSQILVRHQDRLYLIGLQLELPVDRDDYRELQRSLHSLRFLK